jgi:FAD/FMN-containing dehydrogenase
VTVGAGAVLEGVHRHVEAAGLELAVDLAARGTATIGGMIATNAGGTRVLRHGSMRAQVLGVEAVLGDGSIVSHLGGLLKDNTGYDLAGLLCGSEGTLGIVTRARLRLVPSLPERVVVLVGTADLDAAIACFVAARDGAPSLEAAEVVFADGIDLVCAHLGLAAPFPAPQPVALLLECRGRTDPTAELLDALSPVADRIGATAVADSAARGRELWRYREAHTEAINAVGIPHKLDVTLPLREMASFRVRVRDAVASVAPHARTYLFGHLGDGNIHVNVVAPRRGAAVPDVVDGVVLELVAAAGGSISAEHGIGTAKRSYLRLARSDAEIAAFRRVKAAMDPSGILNPNVLFPQ